MHWLIFLEKKRDTIKKKQYIIFNIKKVRGDAKLRKNEGVLLHPLYVHC